MLVISTSLILSAADAALPDGTPLIGYDNVATFSTVAASSSAAGYPASNLANPATSAEWRSDSNAVQYLTVTITRLDPVDYVGIARHNFGTDGIAVSVGYFDTASPPVWHELVQDQMPGDNAPLMLQFTPTVLTSISIRLTPAGSNPPRAAVLYVGKLLVMERGVDINTDFPAPPYGRKTKVINGRSESGNYLGRIVTGQWLEWSADFKHITPDWYREEFDPFVVAAQDDTPFFYAWLPEDYPAEVVFAWFADDPIPLTNPITRRVGVMLTCGGIVE